MSLITQYTLKKENNCTIFPQWIFTKCRTPQYSTKKTASSGKSCSTATFPSR